MKKAQIINNGRLHRFWLGGVIGCPSFGMMNINH